MDSEELSSDASCLVDIGDIPELQNVSAEVAISDQSHMTITDQSSIPCITNDESQSSSDTAGVKEEGGEGLEVETGSETMVAVPLSKEDGESVDVENVFQIDPSSVGEGYIILAPDGTSKCIYVGKTFIERFPDWSQQCVWARATSYWLPGWHK